jgi:hypothetical protein
MFRLLASFHYTLVPVARKGHHQKQQQHRQVVEQRTSTFRDFAPVAETTFRRSQIQSFSQIITAPAEL